MSQFIGLAKPYPPFFISRPTRRGLRKMAILFRKVALQCLRHLWHFKVMCALPTQPSRDLP